MRKVEKKAVESILLSYGDLTKDAVMNYQEVLFNALESGMFSRDDKMIMENVLDNMRIRHIDAREQYEEACFKNIEGRSAQEVNDKMKDELNSMFSKYSDMIPVIQSDYQNLFMEMLTIGNFGDKLPSIAKRMMEIKKTLDTRKREMSKYSKENVHNMGGDKEDPSPFL